MKIRGMIVLDAGEEGNFFHFNLNNYLYEFLLKLKIRVTIF